MPDINVILACDNGKPFYWNPLDKNSPNPHVLITGTSGAGKTQLMKTISAELSKYNIPLIIFDKTGEYKELLENNKGEIIDFDENIKINPLILENQRPVDIANEIVSIFDKIFNKGLGPKQENMLREIILESYMRRGIGENTITSTPNNSPTFEDIKQILYKKYIENPKDNEINGIIARLNIFFDSQIFSGERGINFSNLLKPGITIIDLSKLLGGFGSDELVRAVIIFISKKLWDYLYSLKPVNKPELRVILILDEGHYYTFDGSPIDQMIREGRKYGLSVILASQNLKDFKENVINNTALKIALKVEDPSDKRKIMDTFMVKENMLPNEKFDALIKWEKNLKLMKIIPYIEYKNYYNKEKICTNNKYNEYSKQEKNQEEVTILEIPSLKEQQDEKIKNETDTNSIISQIIDNAIKYNNIILLDALYQFSLNPNAKSVGYGLDDIYSRITYNLTLRYSSKEAKETTNYLEELIDKMMEINPNVYEIKELIHNELFNSQGINLLMKDSLNRIKNLSEKDQLIIYYLLSSCKTKNPNAVNIVLSASNSRSYNKELKEINNDIKINYALELSIKANACSKLIKISSGSYERHTYYYSHDFINDIIKELDNSNAVKSFKGGFEKAVAKAIDLWNIEILKVLYDLIDKNPMCYDKNVPNVIINGINGPESYLKTLAHYIKITNHRCAYLIPSWLDGLLRNSFNPIIKSFNVNEKIAGLIIEDFMKQRIPYVNRKTSRDGCFVINISKPDYKQETIKMCFNLVFDYDKLSIKFNNIYVTVFAPANLCNDVEKYEYKYGIIILTPYKAISCSNNLDNEAKELFDKLTKSLI